jgi:hypothetical protein
MLKKEVLLWIGLIVFTLNLNAQENKNVYESFVKEFNKVLTDNNIPIINTSENYLKPYKDDFEYIEDLIATYKPFESEIDDCIGCYRFVIAKPEFFDGECIKGFCINNDGILEISKGKIYYLGNFSGQLPHGQGVLYFVNKGFLRGEFYKGKISEVEFLGTQGQGAALKGSLGFLAKATNWYSSKYQAFYTGSINNNVKMVTNNYKNKLVSPFLDLTLRQDESTNAIKSFFGKIKYNDGNIVEGNFNGNLKFDDGDVKITTPAGQVISGVINKGEIDRYDVKVIEGNTIYKGEVDENFKPHGRGIMVVDGKQLDNDSWVHGKAAGNPSTGLSSNSNARTNYVAQLKQECSKNWSTYKYCGIPNGSITIPASGKRSVLLINLSNQSQKIKIKLLFTPSNSEYGFKERWNSVTIPASQNFSNGIEKKLTSIHYPFGGVKHSIAIKGDGVNYIFWVIR